MDSVDRVGHWLYKIGGFGLEIFALLILSKVRPGDFEAGAVGIVIAMMLSILGLWLILLGERLSRRERP